MGKVNALLSKRLGKKENTKMATMAKQSAGGHRSGFAGIFSVAELSEKEKASIENMLKEFHTGKENLTEDLASLISLTAEVKAINNQAAILHGERIKKAHSILTQYRDGAFSQWLIDTYGNRQTPYNFMQYYDFYNAMPQNLRPLIEAMPRQAIYTLASREGPVEKKRAVVENYQGETKLEVLNLIREAFPLKTHDKRRSNIGEGAIQSLKKLCDVMAQKPLVITREQKNEIYDLLAHLNHLVSQA